MTRPLPFRYTATLHEQGGAEVAEVPCSIWTSHRTTSTAGEYYDHDAEAPLRLYEELAVENRHLRLLGVRYHIVEVTREPDLPHAALRLRRRSG